MLHELIGRSGQGCAGDWRYFQAGKSFSINNSYTIGSDLPYFEVYLNKSLSYIFLLHDPDYYVPNTNPDISADLI